MTTLKESLISQGWKEIKVNQILLTGGRNGWKITTNLEDRTPLEHVFSVDNEIDFTTMLGENLSLKAVGNDTKPDINRAIADRMQTTMNLPTVFLGPGIISIEPLEVDRDGNRWVGLWMIAGASVD